MLIREATPSDYAAIRAVIRHAFAQSEEANIVEQIRADGDALLELVAADDIALQGHVLFSPLAIERPNGNLKAAALAPMSVLPALQRKGVGSALVREGVERCAALGLDAIVVLGHPAYYPKFGFSEAAAAPLDAPFSGPTFMALELKRDALKAGGRVRYANAFGVA